ncbi:phosphoribosyltransferase [Nocardia callitridis]|uniref:RNA binding Pelota-like protein n=1 Tax=Nocardia callitridis TaxID=648753 RepID=A0ABP9JYW2_9NOCA
MSAHDGDKSPWPTREFGFELRHVRAGGGIDWQDILPANLSTPELVQPGLRRNPRRAHLLVSTVLGKHLPTDPRVVLAGGNRLGDLVTLALDGSAAVVLGFAETATGLGHTVAARIGAECYLHSTRREVPTAPTTAGFEEGHSHATSHLLQPMPVEVFVNELPLVLVDDEISTGRTAIDAIRALHAFAPRTHYVLASLVDMRGPDDMADFGKFTAELGVRIDTVALAHGATVLPDDMTLVVNALPEPTLNPTAPQRGSVVRLELAWPEGVPEGGRHGILASDTAAFEQALETVGATASELLDSRFAGRRVIVIGHEELMYLPLRMAAVLAESGRETRFQTTTRSPAYVADEPGYPLRRGFRFQAPEFEQPQPRFLYNAQWGPGFAGAATGEFVSGETDSEPPVLLVVIDTPADTNALVADDGLVDVLTASGADVVLAVVPGADPRRLRADRLREAVDAESAAAGEPATSAELMPLAASAAVAGSAIVAEPATSVGFADVAGPATVAEQTVVAHQVASVGSSTSAEPADSVGSVTPVEPTLPAALAAAAGSEAVVGSVTAAERVVVAESANSGESSTSATRVTSVAAVRPATRTETPTAREADAAGSGGEAELPAPLTAPEFGSYAAEEVSWLLTDLSGVALEADVAERERRAQSGKAHYAESLPIEYQPDAAYRALFDTVLAESAQRLALATATVAELVVAERGSDIVLVSLARAGTPVGILMRRWLAARTPSLRVPHYAVSIVRDRGIDATALDYLAHHHDPSSVVFVDGWTGKGAITKELTEALELYHARGGAWFDPELAVLADPGHCARTYGTRDDFLIASACLNSTVSGLVSRTVLNDTLIGPGDFHGAKYYRELADDDVSVRLLDTVSGAFDTIRSRVPGSVAAIRASDRTPTWAGMASVERVRAAYGIESVNFVKPGVGETTRVLLRRVPWRVLVRVADAPEHAHIRMLAAARAVPVEVVPDLAYSCMGLIKDVRR